jgi:aspartate aminotransferase
MCKNILDKTGVALLPGSDFGVNSEKMLARLSYTDFNGDNFLANIKGGKNLNNIDINKFAPNIAEGISKLKDWSKSL